MSHLMIAMVLAVAPIASPVANQRNSGDTDAGEGEGLPCPECHLPRICCFEPTPEGFIATLCGHYSDQWRGVRRVQHDGTVAVGPGEHARPRVELRARHGWRWLEPQAPPTETLDFRSGVGPSCGPARPIDAPACPAQLKAALTSRDRLPPGQYGDQGIGYLPGRGERCVARGGYVWFGIGFYGGEGMEGVGGIGRLDPRTALPNGLEIRRPRLLRAWSSAALVHDGRWLWLAPYHFGEWDYEPALGVVRYDWARDRLLVEPDAWCGSYVLGMIELDGALWLATGLNVSRRGAGGRWEHFAFRPGRVPAVERTTCERLYELGSATVPAKHREFIEREVNRYRSVRAKARAAAARP